MTFISSSATDSALARKVATRLETRGFRVVSADQLKPGVPWDVALDGLLRSADVAVFLLSGRSSLFVYNEIERALAYEVSHIVPVVIGTSVEIPPRLEQFTAIQVDAADDEAVARQILAAADAAGWFDAR